MDAGEMECCFSVFMLCQKIYNLQLLKFNIQLKRRSVCITSMLLECRYQPIYFELPVLSLKIMLG